MNIKDIFATAAAVILSLGGGAVIVLALSGWLGKVWASRILERERVALQKAAFEHQTRFSWYHQRKAELIATLYALLNEANEHVKQFVGPVQPNDQTLRQQHADKTFETYNKLVAEFYGKKIFLEKDICEKFQVIITTLYDAIVDFQLSQQEHARNAQLWAQANQTMRRLVPPLLAELEETFRTMLSNVGPAA